MRASKFFWLVLGAGIALRLVFWACQAVPAGDDGMRYLSESYNLVRHGVFSTTPIPNDASLALAASPSPSAHDMPLWPAIMAVIYWTTDSLPATQTIAVFINIILCALGGVALCALLRNKPFSLSDRQVALGCAVYLFMPESLVYSLYHMPDQLAVTAVLIGLYFYFKSAFDNPRYFIGTVIAFIAAIYAKPICIPLAFALLVALALLMRGQWWKRILLAALCCAVVAASFHPWMMRNEKAFGTRGLTSISGTNLYQCNWKWLVASRPTAEREKLETEMASFEKTIADDDLMMQSQKQGAYAQRQILSHLPQYLVWTAKRHPRLYAGTGTVALLRYLGCDRLCGRLDSLWGSAHADGLQKWTAFETFAAAAVQILSWLLLLVGYVLVLVGIARGFRRVRQARDGRLEAWLVYLCPVLCLVLLALVIGPVTATRYRYAMIPFFAILAAQAIPSHNVHQD